MSNSCDNQHATIRSLNLLVGEKAAQESDAFIKTSGENSMLSSYIPLKDTDVVTKKYLSESVSILIAQGHTVHRGSYPMPIKFSPTEDIFYNYPMLEEGMIWKEGDFFLSVDGLNLYKLVKSPYFYVDASDFPPVNWLLNGVTYVPCDYRMPHTLVYEIEIFAEKEYIIACDDPSFPWDDINWDLPETQDESFWNLGFFVENQLSCNTKKKFISPSASSIHYRISKIITGENTYTLRVSHFLDTSRLLWTQVNQSSLTFSISDLYEKQEKINANIAPIMPRIAAVENRTNTFESRLTTNTEDIQDIRGCKGLFELFLKTSKPRINAEEVLNPYNHPELDCRFQDGAFIIDPIQRSTTVHIFTFIPTAVNFLLVKISYTQKIEDYDFNENSFIAGYISGLAYSSNSSPIGCFLDKRKEIIYARMHVKVEEYVYFFPRNSASINAYFPQNISYKWFHQYKLEFFNASLKFTF